MNMCQIGVITGDMRIIAHRGWSGKYPENTMLAFNEAIGVGADGIELDVHLSKDNEVMIIHDESLLRTAGVDALVSELTRSELERISAGKTMNDVHGFTPIPSLEEYLDRISKTSIITNIELKTAPCHYPGIERRVLELVKRFSYEDRVIFSSFNWLSVMEMKRQAKELPCALLIEGISIKNIAEQISSLGFEYYHPSFSILSDEDVNSCKEHGVGLNVWTVNKEEEMAKCKKWGIDGMITNHVDAALSFKG